MINIFSFLLLINTIIIFDKICQITSSYIYDDNVDDDFNDQNNLRITYNDKNKLNNNKYQYQDNDEVDNKDVYISKSSSTSSSSSRRSSMSYKIERKDNEINSNLIGLSNHNIVGKDQVGDKDHISTTAVSEYVVKSFFAGLQVRPKLGR